MKKIELLNLDTMIKFNAVIKFKGESYGSGNCLVHKEDEPLVEFYDTRYPHTEFGQFVSRYYLSTIVDHRDDCGLCLNGGIDDWWVSNDNMKELIKFIKSENIT